MAKCKGLQVPEILIASDIGVMADKIYVREKNMLREFELWLHTHTDYQSVYNESELSDSMVIGFENNDYIAKFTVWDDLSCMSEVMRADSGVYKLNNRSDFLNFGELLSIFMVFTNNLK